MNEAEATPDETYELGRVAGYDEGWDECAAAIVKWLHQMDRAAPMWEWADSYAHDITHFFVNAPKYVAVERPGA